jgi:hypothetical protein
MTISLFNYNTEELFFDMGIKTPSFYINRDSDNGIYYSIAFTSCIRYNETNDSLVFDIALLGFGLSFNLSVY